MKPFLLFAFFLLSLSVLHAQDFYVPGQVTKGETAAYYCTDILRGFVLKVRNVHNVDTTDVMYYNDGTVASEEISGMNRNKRGDLYRAFREVLTDTEWNVVKSIQGYGLTIHIVADSLGNTVEISFSFRKSDPVMTRLPPDRLYQLEQKLKKITKMSPSTSTRKIRNIKYFQVIDYRELE